MTLTVTMYTSEDVGAPTWDGTFQGLINVLTACLVDGYGDKVAAGWTKPLSDSSRAAFKNNETDGGSGCFVLLTEHDSSNARALACADMPDIDTKTYPTGEVFVRHNSQDGWAVWADGLTFYLWAYRGSGSITNNWRVASYLFGGDYKARFVNDYPYFVIGRPSTSQTSIDAVPIFGLNSSGRTSNSTFLGVDPDGLSGGLSLAIRGIGWASAGNAGTSAAPLSKTGGSYLFAPADIAGDSAVGISPGHLRGAFTCGSDMDSFYDLADPDGNLIQREVQTDYWMIPAFNTASNTAEYSRGTILFDASGPWS